VGATDPQTGRLVKTGVAPGRHHVRLTRAGYEDTVQDLDVAPGGAAVLRATLAPVPAVSTGARMGFVALALLAIGVVIVLAWLALRRPEEPNRLGERTPRSRGHEADAATPSGISPGARSDEIGLTYPRWSLGLLHQTALRSDLQTQARVAASDAPPESSPKYDGTLRFPRAFGLGGAWRPATRWTVALDLTWDNWKKAELDLPVIGRVNLFDNLPADRTATRNTLAVNAGAEHIFAGEGFVVPLRFGVAWEPQGGRNPYTLDAVNHTMLAAGTGYNTNSVKFDAAFQYRWARFRDGANFGTPGIGSVLLPVAVGERDSREWRLKLSLILRVTDTDKLHRAIRRVFGSAS
jgi:hypothetical protein